MKHVLSVILTCMLLLITVTAAFSDTLYEANDIDLSGVQEIDGRLVGEIHLPNGVRNDILLVDCPLPEGLTQEQNQKLYVEYKRISKKEMIAALKAIWQKGSEDTISIFNSNPQTCAEFSLEPHGIPEYYFWGRLMDAEASADAAYKTEYNQAKNVLGELITQLGGTPNENLLHATRLDEEHIIPESDTSSSDNPPEWKAKAILSFVQQEVKSGRTERNLTLVNGLYELRGLPVMDQFYWTENKDHYQGESAFFAAVNDEGELRYSKIECLPVITKSEPVAIPDRSWQELLKACIANDWCVSNANSEDLIYEDSNGKTITCYATHIVITGLHPCWVGAEKNSLVPGFYLTYEERVSKDNTLRSPWSSYGDAQTMTTCISH